MRGMNRNYTILTGLVLIGFLMAGLYVTLLPWQNGEEPFVGCHNLSASILPKKKETG